MRQSSSLILSSAILAIILFSCKAQMHAVRTVGQISPVNTSANLSGDPVTAGLKNIREIESNDSFYPKANNSFRVVTYNVGAFSKYTRNSTGMIAAMLREVRADLVGINEADSVNVRHMTFQVKNLADSLGGWNFHFGKALSFKGGSYGNGALTRDSIVRSYTVHLEKGSGSEPRSLAVIETENYIFGAAHLDHISTEATLNQAAAITRWALAQDFLKPILFAGDMNVTPESETIASLKKDWDILTPFDSTFISTSPSKCIDYIFHFKKSAPVIVKGGGVMDKFHSGDARKASDHLPVYVDIELPKTLYGLGANPGDNGQMPD